jgi:hypothetical protein
MTCQKKNLKNQKHPHQTLRKTANNCKKLNTNLHKHDKKPFSVISELLTLYDLKHTALRKIPEDFNKL